VQLTERDQLSLVRIQEHGRRLNRLVEDLVDASRLDRVRLSGPPARLDMAALVRGVAADIGPSLDVHQLQLGLPDAPLWLDGDGLRLEQVVANLIKNALKYSPAGGTIAVRLAQTATAVELSVADQGVGIPASDIPHLFEQYYRASNVDPQQIRGFGIGLSLVAAVVAEHGGDVQVSSVVGVGSTFTVVLPRVATEPLSPPAMR
jgi:signal transduction histidine kinase